MYFSRHTSELEAVSITENETGKIFTSLGGLTLITGDVSQTSSSELQFGRLFRICSFWEKEKKKILPITILKINTQKISNGKVQEILQIYLLNLSLNEKGDKKSTTQTMFLEDM